MTSFADKDVVQGSGTVVLLDMFKEYLGISGTEQDVPLTNALDSAGATIEVYLDRVIAKREIQEQWPHHFGTVILHEPMVDIGQAVTVYLDGQEQTGYDVYLQRGGVAHLTRTGVRPDMPMDWRPYAQVAVTYTAGFDPLPNDIATAICYTAAPIYTSTGTGNIPGGGGSGAIKSMSIYDVGSISYDVGSSSSSSGEAPVAAGIIPETVTHMLTRYARIAA